jgi:hypothetical protein
MRRHNLSSSRTNHEGTVKLEYTAHTCSIWPHHASLSVLFASLPVTRVFAVVSPLAHTLSPLSPLLPLTRVDIALRSLEHALAFSLASEKFPFVNVSVGFAKAPFAVLTPVGPLALVSSPVIPRLRAESMRSIVTIIALHEV